MTHCPGRDQLERLLDVGCGDGADEELVRHVESCAACQQALETMVGTADWGPGLEGWPAPAGRPPPELNSFLRRLQQALPWAIGRGLRRTEDPPSSTSSSASVPDATKSFDPGAEPGNPGRLGDYRILREIARGGMGIVYEAVQESLGRHVALKVLPHHRMTDPDQLERFQREARAAAMLHHTHIVPVFGVGAHEGVHYYAMQYIQGQGLDAVLREVKRLRGGAPAGPAPSSHSGPDPGWAASAAVGLMTGRFPDQSDTELGEGAWTGAIASRGPADPPQPRPRGPSTTPAGGPTQAVSVSSVLGESGTPYYRSVARIGVQAAEALAYAHHHKLLHRDIKPANLLLDLGGSVWVTDFGLAKAEGTEGLTHTGDLVGTLLYMAPEQFRGQADTRSDVYSLGLTLYEMLTLEPAFAADQRARLIDQILHEEPARPRRFDPRVPLDLETIVLKAMAKDPSDRYRAASDLVEDLERFLADRPILARRTGPIERAVRWSRRNRALARVTIALLLALVLGFLGVTTQWIRAEHNADREATARRAAEAARQQTHHYLYVARMNLAQQASEAGQTRRLLELLKPYQPGAEQARLRGFEWYYWWRTCHLYRSSLGGHYGQVNSVAFDPRGGSLASGSDDGLVRIWDPATGQLQLTLPGDGGVAQSLAFSPDGQMLARASEHTSSIRILDFRTGATRATLEAHGPVMMLAFSPNGAILAANGNRTIRLWDVTNGQPRAPLPGDAGPIPAVAFSPDGKVLASNSGDYAIKLWDVTTGALTHTLKGHTHEVCALAFSPDGATLASGAGGDDMHVLLWDLATKKIRATLSGHTNVIRVVGFSPDGRTLASAGDDGAVRLWDPTTGIGRAPLQGHANTVPSLAFSPDGATLASASHDGTIKLWDLATIQPESSLSGHRDAIYTVAISPDDSTLASASIDGAIKLWNLANGRLRTTLETGAGGIRCVVFSPDGAILASAHADGTIRLWDLATGQPGSPLQGHASAVLSLAFSPDGVTLASVSYDKTVKLWDPATHALKATLLAPKSVAMTKPLVDFAIHGACVAFSPDGATLASCNTDRLVTLWDLATREPKVTIESQAVKWPPIAMPFTLAFSLDGATLASGGWGQDVELWDTATGKLRNTLKAHSAWVRSLAFCPDGKTLASASDDRSVVLWDVLTGEPKTVLGGQTSYVLSLAFSRDGSIMACGTRGKTVTLWRAATEAQVLGHRE